MASHYIDVMVAIILVPISKVIESAGEVGTSAVSLQKFYFPLVHGEVFCHGVVVLEAWVEFLPTFPCSSVEEGATEVEVEVPTRVVLAAAFVFLGKVKATLVFVSVSEIGTIAL